LKHPICASGVMVLELVSRVHHVARISMDTFVQSFIYLHNSKKIQILLMEQQTINSGYVSFAKTYLTTKVRLVELVIIRNNTCRP
jgi:hypothetical protein